MKAESADAGGRCEPDAWAEAADWLETEKRTAVGAMAADLAHDLAGPTVYFEGLARALAAGDAIDGEELDAAREEAERLRRLLSAMRRVQLRERPRMTVVVRPLLLRALRAATTHAVEVDVPENLTLTVDARSFAVLVGVLVRNAVAAAGPIGRVSVRMTVSDAHVWLDVCDSGHGVPRSRLPDLFRPFASLAPDGAGTGLAIALRIARTCGWALTHARQEGQTSFHVALPIDEATGEKAGPS